MLSEFQQWSQLGLVGLSKQQSFDEFATTMRNPSIVQTTHQFLQQVPLNIRHSLNARILLSSLLLAQFPAETISSERNELEETLHQTATQMVDFLGGETITYQKCDIIFGNYASCFKIWRKQDQEDLVQLMSKVHKQVRSLEDSIPPEDTQRVLSKIETVAESIAGEKGVKHVREASQYGLAEADIIASQVAQQMRRAFWDLLEKDLSEDPPNFKQYPGLVGDVRTRIERLLPRHKLAETVDFIRTRLDEDQIKNQIEENTYELQDIYNLLVFVLKRVKELGPASEDEAIHKSIDHVHSEMEKAGELGCDLSKLIPKVFQEALERLDVIGFTKDAVQEEIRRQREAKDKSEPDQDQDKDPDPVPDHAAHMYS